MTHPTIQSGDAVYYNLPSLTAVRDIVAEIEQKQARAKRRRNAGRCFGSLSCDCPRCR